MQQLVGNGSTKLLLKIGLVTVASVAVVALIVSANWGAMFRDLGANAQIQKNNEARIERNEKDIEKIRGEYVTKEAYQEILRRMDSLERNQQTLIALYMQGKPK